MLAVKKKVPCMWAIVSSAGEAIRLGTAVYRAPVRVAQGLGEGSQRQWQRGRVEMTTTQLPCISMTCDASPTLPTGSNLAECPVAECQTGQPLAQCARSCSILRQVLGWG